MNRIESIRNLPETGTNRNKEYKQVFELIHKNTLNNILYDIVSICEELAKYHVEEHGDKRRSNEYMRISAFLEDVRKDTPAYL